MFNVLQTPKNLNPTPFLNTQSNEHTDILRIEHTVFGCGPFEILKHIEKHDPSLHANYIIQLLGCDFINRFLFSKDVWKDTEFDDFYKNTINQHGKTYNKESSLWFYGIKHSNHNENEFTTLFKKSFLQNPILGGHFNILLYTLPTDACYFSHTDEMVFQHKDVLSQRVLCAPRIE